MKTRLRLIFSALPFLVFFAGCGSDEKETVENAPPDVEINPPTLQVNYAAWNEAITIDGKTGALKHTKTEHEYDNPVSGTPSGQTVHTVAEGTLTEEQMTALATFINDAGFLLLDSEYGAPENQRYYPYRLSVMLPDGFEKDVIFRSNPEFGDEPEEFKAVVEELKRISGSITSN